MVAQHIDELTSRVDRALEGGSLTQKARRVLIDVLTPDTHQPRRPAVEVVLHVVEHEVIAARIRTANVPGKLHTAITEAFMAVSPLLGIRPGGALGNFADRARRRFDAEGRKYDLVADRLAQLDPRDEQVRMLRRYLTTDPAPLFVARLRQRYPSRIDEAQSQRDAGVELAVLGEAALVLDALQAPDDADPEAFRERLDELAAHPDISEATLQRAFEHGSDDQQLVAAAVAAYRDNASLAPSIVRLVLSGVDYVAQLAVIAAQLAPLAARQVYGQFLAEVAWQNPEEPEAEINAERTHAILSVRCVLPRLGSPLESVGPDHVPDSLGADQLRDIPDLVAASWALCQKLSGRG